MRPRTKVQANGGFARRARRDKTCAREVAKANGTFDVDESVAAQVFSHVTNVRDRLALSCVSRVWRKVAASDGAWGTCELVIDAKLGKRLTDDRFGNLIRYCGDVKHLEVRDANRLTLEEGSCCPSSRFASLESLNLTGCSGLRGDNIVDSMNEIGMLDRPREDRLRYIFLAGCDVVVDNLPALRGFLRTEQKENFPGFKVLPAEETGSFDLWQCESCEEVMQTCEAEKCVSCSDTHCDECADGGFHFCNFCEAFACSDECAAGHSRWCESCGTGACVECADKHDLTVCTGNSDIEGCFTSICADCIESYFYFDCEACDGCWCDNCAFDDDVAGAIMCAGCGSVTCRTCIATTKKKYVECEECEEIWCSDCDPPALKQEHTHCARCSTSWCVEVVCCESCWNRRCGERDPGRDSGRGPEYKACCPDCLVDAMKEFILS